MKIHVYCICRNEKRMIPYFLRHYEQFAECMFFWDDHSDDGTRELINANGNACLFDWPGPSGIVDEHFKSFSQSEYKRSREIADWVFWVDTDEFIYHPQIVQVLERYLAEGVEVPLVEGYNMVGYKFPTTAGQIYDELKTGYRAPVFDKAAVFQPKMDMRWDHGKHHLEQGFQPKRSISAELKLLHFRYIDPDYVKQRQSNNWSRMPEANRKGGFGWTCNPAWKGEHSYEWYMAIRPDQLHQVIP